MCEEETEATLMIEAAREARSRGVGEAAKLEHGVHVRLADQPVLVVGVISGALADVRPRIVDEDVELADAFEDARAVRGRGDVRSDAAHAAIRGPALHAIGRACDADDVRAVIDELVGDGQTDAGGDAGDERGLSAE